jgi:hypothetical protein
MSDGLGELGRRVRATYRPIPVPFDSGQQCLQNALAECLRLPPARVPMRCDHEELDDWDRKVAERLGVRLELIYPDEEPPREPWIAIVPSGYGDETTHAVAVFGNSPDARGRLAGFRIRTA